MNWGKLLAQILPWLAWLLLVPALGIGGPHTGTFSDTTDACAGCHRPHQGQAPGLLTTVSGTSTALCLSCHGSGGVGANTNVEDGIELASGWPLRGGGFANAKMDTQLVYRLISRKVTSSHTMDGSLGTAWGGDGPGAGPRITLECTSCHDPHGNANYRSLRFSPLGSGEQRPVAVVGTFREQIPWPGYTIRGDSYWGQHYTGLEVELSRWCATCHDRFLGEPAQPPDPLFNHVHPSGTVEVYCLSCHVAHGTSARMTTGGSAFSSSMPYPDGRVLPPVRTGDERSALLRLDNRGICVQCHLSSDGQGITRR
ncbi:MAG: cytochrome c3 family protein [Deinococcus sp.]|nr:cytochrome c3 family protein [Deinococcus sp.]